MLGNKFWTVYSHPFGSVSARACVCATHIYCAIRNQKSNLCNDGIITINFQNLIIICNTTSPRYIRVRIHTHTPSMWSVFGSALDWRFTISHDRSYHLCAVDILCVLAICFMRRHVHATDQTPLARGRISCNGRSVPFARFDFACCPFFGDSFDDCWPSSSRMALLLAQAVPDTSTDIRTVWMARYVARKPTQPSKMMP